MHSKSIFESLRTFHKDKGENQKFSENGHSKLGTSFFNGLGAIWSHLRPQAHEKTLKKIYQSQKYGLSGQNCKISDLPGETPGWRPWRQKWPLRSQFWPYDQTLCTKMIPRNCTIEILMNSKMGGGKFIGVDCPS